MGSYWSTIHLFQVARLAKYWNSTISLSPPTRVSARSTIFELLGITSRSRRRKEDRTFHSQCLQKLSWNGCVTGRIKGSFIISFTVNLMFRKKILKKKPLILDPSSPYNNLMDRFPRNVMQLFSECASESLSTFDVDIKRAVHMHSGNPKIVRPRKNKKPRHKKKLQSQILSPVVFETTMNFYWIRW